MKQIKILIIVIGIISCLLAFSSCVLTSDNNSEDASITKIEIGTSNVLGMKNYYFLSSEPKTTEIQRIQDMYVKAYSGNKILSERSGLEKAIRWVSDAPDILIVSSGYVGYKGEKLPLKIKFKESFVLDGIYEIHAENSDGSVKSQSFKIVIGAPIEAITRLELTNKSSSKVDVLSFDSDENGFSTNENLRFEAFSFENEKLKNKEVEKHIKWVSTDPDVVSILPNGNSGKLELKSEGISEIYVETEDGEKQSKSITVAYGNQFNKEYLANDFAAKYVLDHLRYKTKYTDYKMTDLYARKTFFISGFKMKIGYSRFSDTSTVETKDTIFEDNEITIKGIVETYTEDYKEIRFSFAIRLKIIPDSNFTSYEVTSSNYEMPEYIIQDVDIEK